MDEPAVRKDRVDKEPPNLVEDRTESADAQRAYDATENSAEKRN